MHRNNLRKMALKELTRLWQKNYSLDEAKQASVAFRLLTPDEQLLVDWLWWAEAKEIMHKELMSATKRDRSMGIAI